VDERQLLREMLEFISPEVEELGNQAEIAHIEQTQDLKAVVDYIVRETCQGFEHR
jgi:hypothetical protein